MKISKVMWEEYKRRELSMNRRINSLERTKFMVDSVVLKASQSRVDKDVARIKDLEDQISVMRLSAKSYHVVSVVLQSGPQEMRYSVSTDLTIEDAIEECNRSNRYFASEIRYFEIEEH